MNIYHLVLFLHVTGDIGLFFGLGIQWLGLMALRRVKRIEQARGIAGLVAIANPIGTISALLTIASGFYMALTVWGLQTSWILVALASIVVFISPAIGLVIEPHTRAITAAIREEPNGPLSAALSMRIHDPTPIITLQTMVTLLIGIVFLMTNKPALIGAIMTVVMAVVIGLASGLPWWRKENGRMHHQSEGRL